MGAASCNLLKQYTKERHCQPDNSKQTPYNTNNWEYLSFTSKHWQTSNLITQSSTFVLFSSWHPLTTQQVLKITLPECMLNLKHKGFKRRDEILLANDEMKKSNVIRDGCWQLQQPKDDAKRTRNNNRNTLVTTKISSHEESPSCNLESLRLVRDTVLCKSYLWT